MTIVSNVTELNNKKSLSELSSSGTIFSGLENKEYPIDQASREMLSRLSRHLGDAASQVVPVFEADYATKKAKLVALDASGQPFRDTTGEVVFEQTARNDLNELLRNVRSEKESESFYFGRKDTAVILKNLPKPGPQVNY